MQPGVGYHDDQFFTVDIKILAKWHFQKNVCKTPVRAIIVIESWITFGLMHTASPHPFVVCTPVQQLWGSARLLTLECNSLANLASNGHHGGWGRALQTIDFPSGPVVSLGKTHLCLLDRHRMHITVMPNARPFPLALRPSLSA